MVVTEIVENPTNRSFFPSDITSVDKVDIAYIVNWPFSEAKSVVASDRAK